jgi:alkylated DNA repair protein (DNA oxidative demethylase)
MNTELFPLDTDLAIAPGAWLLPGFALGAAEALLAAVGGVLAQAPLRQLHTPGGQLMQVAMSNCGELGWVSDAHGYRYQALDPNSGKRWPSMPAMIKQLAQEAAQRGGFAAFSPDACLINRYLPGTRLSLHQDRDERDFSQPIVSISLGLPATFLFGGLTRADKPAHLTLRHGDVLVWGGPSRLRFHGVLPLAEGEHPLVGRQRINLTLRRAG